MGVGHTEAQEVQTGEKSCLGGGGVHLTVHMWRCGIGGGDVRKVALAGPNRKPQRDWVCSDAW